VPKDHSVNQSEPPSTSGTRTTIRRTSTESQEPGAPAGTQGDRVQKRQRFPSTRSDPISPSGTRTTIRHTSTESPRASGTRRTTGCTSTQSPSAKDPRRTARRHHARTA
jgi:hypothetical protein